MPSTDLDHRVARLELLIVALIASDAPDFPLWMLRPVFERTSPNRWGPEFEDLLLHLRHRPSYETQLRELQTQVAALSEQWPDLMDQSADAKLALRDDLYSLLIAQSIGVDYRELATHRPIALRIYLKNEDAPKQEQLAHALTQYAGHLGFDVAVDYPAESGSWYKRWFGRSKEVLKQPEVQERLQKAERAIELAALQKHQAGIDKDQATAASSLITALDKIPNAVCQIGSILIVKVTDGAGPRVVTRSLTQAELIHLEKNQPLLKQPEHILDALGALQNAGAPALPNGPVLDTFDDGTRARPRQ